MIIYGDQKTEVPSHAHFGRYMLSNLKKANGNDVCLENGVTRETLTYKEATQYAVNLAVALSELGIKRGDVVAIGSESFLHYVPTILAITFTGAAYTAYELDIGRAVLKHKLQLVKPKYFICSAKFWQTFKDVLETFGCIETYIAASDIPELSHSLKSLSKVDVNVENFEPIEVQGTTDTVLLSYSSGTTGMPKGVEITHYSCILTCIPDAFRQRPSLQTAFMNILKGNVFTFMTFKFLVLGRKVIFTTDFKMDKLLTIIKDGKVDVIFTAPSFIRRIALYVTPEQDHFECVKMIYCRSAPLRRETIKYLKYRFPKVKDIIQGLGLTECGEPISEIWATKSKPGSIGVVSPGVQVKIVNVDTRAILGPNQHGEICVKGPMNLKGYKDIDRLEYLDEDGYYKTGDLGYFDEEHYFYIVDRLTDIISMDGTKLSPVEVENVLLQHPEVHDAGVIGRPDPADATNELPMAFVVKKPGSNITESELIEFTISEENGLTRETMTYKAVTQFAVNLSVALTKLGAKKGDVVAIGSETSVYCVPTFLAVTFTGAAYTAYELEIGRAVLKHKLQLVKPKYFICSALFWQAYKDVLKSFSCIETYIAVSDVPDIPYSLKSLTKGNVDVNTFEPEPVHGNTDTVLILYSSGTTGMPKGVEITHKSCILTSLPDPFVQRTWLQTAFLYGPAHTVNLFVYMTYKFVVMGRRVVFTTDLESTDNNLRIIRDCKVDVIFTSPNAIRMLAIEVMPEDIDSVKMIYCRSAPLREHTITLLKERFPKAKEVIQAMGLTECGEPMSEIWAPKPKPGSVGVVTPGVQVKIVDPDTRVILGPYQRGEICVKGSMIMKGYLDIDRFDYLDEDGYYKTGDLGYFDEEHYFYVVDRLTDIISLDGWKISPVEVENLLLQHPEVQDAGVVGKPDPIDPVDGYPMAFVVKRPGSNVTENELIEFIASEVSPHMQLKGGVRFIHEIPRNPRGKILRRQLKEMLNETN